MLCKLYIKMQLVLLLLLIFVKLKTILLSYIEINKIIVTIFISKFLVQKKFEKTRILVQKSNFYFDFSKYLLCLVVRVFNPGTCQARTGRYLNLKIIWSTQCFPDEPELHSEVLFQNKINSNRHKELNVKLFAHRLPSLLARF